MFYKNGVKWNDDDSKSKQTLEKQLDEVLVNEIRAKCMVNSVTKKIWK